MESNANRGKVMKTRRDSEEVFGKGGTKVELAARLTAVAHVQEMSASDRRRREKTCLL